MCEVIPHYGFDLHFLDIEMSSDIEYFLSRNVYSGPFAHF